MVMDILCPQSVGLEFVRQYYTVLNQMPLHLHRFYSENSSFVHGGHDRGDKAVHGQQEIHEKIMQLNFREAKTKILLVDAHSTLSEGVVVQVLGELSNNKGPMRKFMQTFVLAPKSPKMYYVYNDIFHYQDEIFTDMATDVEATTGAAPGFGGPVDNMEPTPPFEPNIAAENEKNCAKVASDGIATVSIIAGPVVQKEPATHLNGEGQEGHNTVESVNVDPHVADPDPRSPDPPAEDPEPTNPVEEVAKAAPKSPAPPLADKKDDSVTPSPPAPVASNEPRTYATLVKASAAKSAGMVPSGPVNLPPAGFGKTAANQSSGSSVSPVAPSAVSPSSSTTGLAPATPGSGSPRDAPTGPKESLAPNMPTFSSGKEYCGRGSGNSGGRDRYQSSHASTMDGPGADKSDHRGAISNHRMAGNINWPDSHQIFVGNLPHTVQESDLRSLFSKYGSIADVRISMKGITQSKAGSTKVPNFGFVAFEDERFVTKCLEARPIYLPPLKHRLNVEAKKKNYSQARDDAGYCGSNSSTSSRGAGFDRGSQEHIGQSSGRGLNQSGGRGGGSRGSMRGRGFSGSRGGGSGPPIHNSGSISGSGSGQSQRPYSRRS